MREEVDKKSVYEILRTQRWEYEHKAEVLKKRVSMLDAVVDLPRTMSAGMMWSDELNASMYEAVKYTMRQLYDRLVTMIEEYVEEDE